MPTASNIKITVPVKATKTYNTKAVNTSNGRQVDFTIYKDSTYDAIQRDGEYQIIEGMYLVDRIPADVFSAGMQNSNVAGVIFMLFFFSFIISAPFWLPKLLKKIIHQTQ